MSSTEYHVAAGLFGIYAGKLTEARKVMRSKSDVTEEAISAVRDYMFDQFLQGDSHTGAYSWQRKDGSVVELRISIFPSKEGDS